MPFLMAPPKSPSLPAPKKMKKITRIRMNSIGPSCGMTGLPHQGLAYRQVGIVTNSAGVGLESRIPAPSGVPDARFRRSSANGEVRCGLAALPGHVAGAAEDDVRPLSARGDGPGVRALS